MLWDGACVACRSGNVHELLDCLGDDRNLLMTQNDGSYLIHVAFRAGYAKICFELLNFAQKERCKILDQKDEEGNDAFHIAVAQDRADLMDLLASFGQDTSIWYNNPNGLVNFDKVAYLKPATSKNSSAVTPLCIECNFEMNLHSSTSSSSHYDYQMMQSNAFSSSFDDLAMDVEEENV